MVYQRALKHSTMPFQKSLMSKKCFDTIGWYVHKTMAYFICYNTLLKTDARIDFKNLLKFDVALNVLYLYEIQHQRNYIELLRRRYMSRII